MHVCLYKRLGFKLSRSRLVKTLIEAASKQQKKIERLVTLYTDAEDCTAWLKAIVQLNSYAAKFEEQHVTGAQLLKICSTDELVKLGVDSEVDRMYMLLQV